MQLAYYRHPEDRLHQENLQFLKKLPFLYRWWMAQEENSSDYMPFANQVEQLAIILLENRGYTVNSTAHTAPFDLWAERDGRAIRVEVKGARATYHAANRAWRYQAGIRNRKTDLLFFLCCPEPDEDFLSYFLFIIPKAALGLRRNIAIWSRDPRDYSGRWAKYLNAWGYLDQAYEAAVVQPTQLALLSQAVGGSL